MEHPGRSIAWGRWAIVGDEEDGFGGKGSADSGAGFDPAPDLDHTNEDVRESLKDWLRWLHSDVGFSGWRLDYVKVCFGPLRLGGSSMCCVSRSQTRLLCWRVLLRPSACCLVVSLVVFFLYVRLWLPVICCAFLSRASLQSYRFALWCLPGCRRAGPWFGTLA